MHVPTTTPRASLYYPYRVHPFRRPPEMDGGDTSHPVAIVGAGPVGLTRRSCSRATACAAS